MFLIMMVMITDNGIIMEGQYKITDNHDEDKQRGPVTFLLHRVFSSEGEGAKNANLTTHPAGILKYFMKVCI